MKLGNRKVVLSGLAIAAVATMTAFTQLTPASASTTNLVTAPYLSMDNKVLSATQWNAGAEVAKALTQDTKTNEEDSKKDSQTEDSVKTETLVAEENTASSTDNQETSNQTTEGSQTEDSSTSAETSKEPAKEQSKDTAKEEKKQPSEWDTKVVPKVENALNIRSTPDENGEIIGKLYKGSAAQVLGVENGWTKIKSGNVAEGYVKNDYIAIGEEAFEIAKKDGKVVATITTQTIRVRSSADENASVVDLAAKGDQYTAITAENGWVEIEFEGQPAYVSAQYVSVELQLGEAVTMEEELAAQKAAEEAKKAAEEAKKKKTSTKTQKAAVSSTSDDAMLLAALVQMEAGGESYEGKLAVASVVMNRVRSGAYPGSIRGVIYQSGQFPGAGSGKIDSILANGPSTSCQKAANEALSGADNVGNLTHFIATRVANTGSYGSYTIIGNHCFY